MSNVILIGFMGCGKSTIGKRLSYVLRKPFLDTDKMIERKEDMTISELFDRKGEGYFRDMETACIKELMEDSGEYVIAVGGGLVLREENRRLLAKLGEVVYLRATADTIYERLKKDNTRPLLQGENPQEKIRTMMAQRSDIYEDAARFVVDVDGKEFEEILKEIGEKLS
ncbi:MAG: shikimate kinase [Roseburia sp.]|nr:shikimate kinase [Roseburia sp.]MCM1277830.1 shikimate kinase [Robinsoniella sp.]